MEGSGVISRVAIRSDEIDPGSLLAEVGDEAAGAVLLFLGTARNHSETKTGITHLAYEAYPEEVEATISQLVADAAARWPLIKVAIEHRVGDVEVGKPSVAVAVSAAHRDSAFAAGRFLIDGLKANAPIWKKEHWPGGGEWVEGA
jgi:molybdopterin synthase catalytic subunit